MSNDKKTPLTEGKEKGNELHPNEMSPLSLYLHQDCNHTLLDEEEIIELSKRWRFNKDENAREKLIKHNQRLVVSIAKRYLSTAKRMTLLDLIQEGNTGLFKAVDKYDHTKRGKDGKSAKFSTYASYWIRQRITRAIMEKSGIISVPVFQTEFQKKYYKTFEKLFRKLKREPTYQEIATEMDVKLEKIKKFNEIFRNNRVVYLEDSRGGSDERTIASRIEDKSAVSPLEYVISESEKKEINECLDELKPREAEILRLRFGISRNGEKAVPKTLEEVGWHFDITRERVRQIENNALGKLRKKIENRRNRKVTPRTKIEVDDMAKKEIHLSLLSPATQDMIKKFDSSKDNLSQFLVIVSGIRQVYPGIGVHKIADFLDVPYQWARERDNLRKLGSKTRGELKKILAEEDIHFKWGFWALMKRIANQEDEVQLQELRDFVSRVEGKSSKKSKGETPKEHHDQTGSQESSGKNTFEAAFKAPEETPQKHQDQKGFEGNSEEKTLREDSVSLRCSTFLLKLHELKKEYSGLQMEVFHAIKLLAEISKVEPMIASMFLEDMNPETVDKAKRFLECHQRH